MIDTSQRGQCESSTVLDAAKEEFSEFIDILKSQHDRVDEKFDQKVNQLEDLKVVIQKHFQEI